MSGAGAIGGRRVERAATDDVALAELPSTSGAHWANRDSDIARRRSSGRSAPFRRPPASNSFPGDDPESISPPAYLPAGGGDVPATSWFAGQNTDPGVGPGASSEDTGSPDPDAPRFGPAPPATPGRSSFVVPPGPISPYQPAPAEAATPPVALPTPPAPRSMSLAAGRPSAEPRA